MFAPAFDAEDILDLKPLSSCFSVDTLTICYLERHVMRVAVRLDKVILDLLILGLTCPLQALRQPGS